jgi:hypothetical protein
MADANYIDDSRRKGVRGRASICGLVTYQERENQMAKKLTIVLGVLAMVVLMTALPALAWGSDSGTVSCGNNNIAVHSRTIQDWYHQVPSGSTVASGYTSYWDARTTATLQSGTGSWRVLSVEGSVDTGSTYAYCWGQ